VVQELDFRNEAANGMEFKKSLGFLGYVDVPDTLPELTTRRAMAMEWVRRRRRLSDLADGTRAPHTTTAHRLVARALLHRCTAATSRTSTPRKLCG
jgi:predicted unusual protein kinase regulating ubiquinone biosynthesis (AarF/ABC1/UbiB family)